jgi:hypothetical protein
MKSRLHTKESNDIYDAVRARSLESLEGQQSVEASSVCSALEQLVLDDNANGVEFLLSVIPRLSNRTLIRPPNRTLIRPL